MKKLSSGQGLALDKFREVIEDPRFHRTIKDLQDGIAYYENVASILPAKSEEYINIHLGLLYIKVTGPGTPMDSEEFNVALGEIGNLVKGNQALEVKLRFIEIAYLVLVKENYVEAKRRSEGLTSMLRRTNDELLYNLITRALCIIYLALDNPSRSEECAQDSMSISRRLNSPILYAYALNNFAVLKKKLCQYPDAECKLRQALRICESIGATAGAALCYGNLGIIKMKLGEWENSELYLKRAIEIMELGAHEGKELLMKVNLGHLYLISRRFKEAKDIFLNLIKQCSNSIALRRQCLVNEFLGELYIEIGRFQEAGSYLEKAHLIARDIAPISDVMSEILRRRAQLFFLTGNLQKAEEAAHECIRISMKISDKHELGAVLRILGEVLSEKGLHRKAANAFEASVNVLKSIHESYELMKTCLTYGEYNLHQNRSEADVYLLEAKQLAKKLNLKYFLSKVNIALGHRAIDLGYFMEARVYLQKAELLCESSSDPMEKQLKAEIKFYKSMLEKALLKASMQSAQKLKALGKIYEEARFPMEECSQELALEVARNVGARKLFLIRKRKGRHVIPIRYNITYEDARNIVKNCDNGSARNMFKRKVPSIYKLGRNRKLLCVPGEGDNHYFLCSIVGGERIILKKDIEFLIASVEAMEKIAEESSTGRGIEPGSNVTFGLSQGSSTHPGGSFREIITKDPEIIKLIKLAERAAKTDVPILLQGETGVGKELFARAIHEISLRGTKSFIAINTGGIPLNFLESELFGYVRGAYTGARLDRIGLIEEASGGTLFLDEVAEMSEELQVKLLRLLENGEFRRLGENKLHHSDVRIVSATNMDLDLLVKRGKFRKDLYYRLSTVRFNIPALRFRKGDVELLVRHFLSLSLKKLGKLDGTIDVDVKAIEALELYNWPGNVREIQNEIMRIVSLMGEERIIRFAMLSDAIKNYFRAGRVSSLLEKNVERFERRLILKALEENDWNRVKTAERIGVPRSTLLAKMRRLDIMS